MPAEDVARIMGVASTTPATPEPVPDEAAAKGGITVAALTDAERQTIAQAVRDEMRPLRREIAAYREHNDFQTILGGIGYIVGLFGLGFYLAARRRLAV